MQPIKHLPGLNALRFFAAFFVVISHANLALIKLGMYTSGNAAFLNRGGDAVDFFFTLSGFLITYLLIAEVKSTATISISQFYLRRVFRIWPLYFLIVLIGFFLLGYVYPKMYHQPYFTFSIPQGILLYVFFLPNYAAKNFIVGILNPLWSIGVEEQFYLFWAPIVKWFKGYLKLIIASFVVITILFYGTVYYKLFNIPDNIERFLLTQKFYAMAIGSAFGYVLYFQLNKYNTSFFTSKAMQVIVLFIILYHFLVGFSFSEWFVFKIILAVLYGLLILNVAAINNKIITLQNSTLSYLGVISYGIYMYHMLVDYFLRIVVQKTMFLHIPVTVIVVLYYLLLLAITIFIASFSYTYFEKYFLNIKNKMQRSNLPATA
jgi:peptidoglycan/LPS O-acetylase OafA/YrhL